MTILQTAIDAILGNPSDPNKKPARSGVVQAFTELDAELTTIYSRLTNLETGGVITTELTFTTKAEIDASLNYVANTGAKVVNDPNPVFNGIYKKAGISGSGSWSRIAALPGSIIDARGNVILSGGSSSGPNLRNIIGGAGSLALNTAGSDIVSLGHNALAVYLGSSANAIGSGGLSQATGDANNSFGTSAGSGITTGSLNFFGGHNAGGSTTAQFSAATNSIALGAGAYTTNSFQFGLPDNLESIRAFGIEFMRAKASTRSYYMGENSGRLLATGGAHIGIGAVTLPNVTLGDSLIAIGDYAMNLATVSVNSVAVGRNAARDGTDLRDCVYVGNYTGERSLSGVGDTIIGFRSARHSTEARNNSTLGDSNLWIYQGSNSLTGGYRTAEHLEIGDNNIIFGSNGANGLKSTFRSVLIGVDANSLPGVAVTRNELAGTASGTVTGGIENTGVGYRILHNTRSDKNAALGVNAGLSLIGTVATNGENIFIGPNAGNNASQLTTVTNSVAIGANVFTTANNQFKLGNATQTIFIDGGQIRFPATAIPSANPNTLDRYEEGSTTPTITPGSGSFTTVTAALNYTVMGDRVEGEVVITSTTAGTAGTHIDFTLPFTAVRESGSIGWETGVGGLPLACRIVGTVGRILSTTGAAPPFGNGRVYRVPFNYPI